MCASIMRAVLFRNLNPGKKRFQANVTLNGSELPVFNKKIQASDRPENFWDLSPFAGIRRIP
jgi:hypothetical protein